MKEVILVAGENKLDIGWLRRCLREQGYESIPCKTPEALIEELKILPTCGASVPLAVIQPAMLDGAPRELLARLSRCTPHVPFIALAGQDSSLPITRAFQQVCSGRVPFDAKENPLAEVLSEAGVQLTTC